MKLTQNERSGAEWNLSTKLHEFSDDGYCEVIHLHKVVQVRGKTDLGSYPLPL